MRHGTIRQPAGFGGEIEEWWATKLRLMRSEDGGREGGRTGFEGRTRTTTVMVSDIPLEFESQVARAGAMAKAGHVESGRSALRHDCCVRSVMYQEGGGVDDGWLIE